MAANVVVEMTGDEAKLYRSLQKVVAQNNQTEQSFRKVGEAGRKAGAEANEGFGDKALSSLKAYAGGLMSVGAAAGAATAALRDMRREEEEAARRIRDQEGGLRALAQVAGGDVDYYNRLKQAAKSLQAQRGMDAIPAMQTVFNAASGRAEGRDLVADLPLLGSVTEINMSPAAMTEAAIKLHAAFGGSGAGASGGGNTRQVINKLLAAAGPSPVKTDDIAKAASIASVSYAAVGGQDEDLLAAIGVLSEPFKTPDVAAERIKTFADQLNEKIAKGQIGGMESLRGKTPVQMAAMMGQLERQGRLLNTSGEPVSFVEWMGSSEARQAVSAIQGMYPAIQERYAAITQAEAASGTPGDPLSRALGVVRQDPDLMAAMTDRRSEQRLQILMDRYGTWELLADAVQKRSRERLHDMGNPRFLTSLRGMTTDLQRFVGGDRAYVESAIGDGARAGEGLYLSSADVQEFKRVVQALERAAEKMSGSQLGSGRLDEEAR